MRNIDAAKIEAANNFQIFTKSYFLRVEDTIVEAGKVD